MLYHLQSWPLHSAQLCPGSSESTQRRYKHFLNQVIRLPYNLDIWRQYSSTCWFLPLWALVPWYFQSHNLLLPPLGCEFFFTKILTDQFLHLLVHENSFSLYVQLLQTRTYWYSKSYPWAIPGPFALHLLRFASEKWQLRQLLEREPCQSTNSETITVQADPSP